jgi:transcription elongation GreA/GreB family factor
MAAPIDKRALVELLRAALKAELERATRHALDAAEAATHEENRPENDKDMRSTETSYVARGQALRARELETALERLGALEVRSFPAGAAIEASALVEVEDEERRVCYFIVPAGGGQRLRAGAREVLSLATTSPIGRALLGLSVGEEAEVSTPQGAKLITVLAVS